MADTAKNSFIVVLPNQIITIPQDSNLAWLPLFYALPKELVSKRKDYLEIPRSPYDVLRTDKYEKLINDDGRGCCGVIYVHGGDAGIFNPKRHENTSSVSIYI